MDKHYTIYIKTNCPFCVQARDELFRQKVSHTVHVMDDKLEGLQKMKEFFEYKTVPMVFVQQGEHERFIGGYTDLKEYFDN